MMIVIAAQNHEAIDHLVESNLAKEHQFIWVKSIDEFEKFADADGFIDLIGSELDYSKINGPLLVNHTSNCLADMITADRDVARFCGWPGFVERSKWELAVANELSSPLKQILKALNKEYIIVADTPGLIAPRILCMIINEACFALDEGISDAAQIDAAMKLGTNYPEGPLAWGNKIGADHIVELLEILSAKDSRYQPQPSIQKFLA